MGSMGDGLLQYPVLTADILRYDAAMRAGGRRSGVPPGAHARTKKMSKSTASVDHAIALLDPPDASSKKIMRAVTDAQPGVNVEDPADGVANLLGIFQVFSEWPDDKVKRHFAGMRYAISRSRGPHTRTIVVPASVLAQDRRVHQSRNG